MCWKGKWIDYCFLIINVYLFTGGESMLGLEILVRINPEKRVEFLQAFDMLKTIDQLEDRRLDLELFERVNESNTFLWLEHWDNNESLTQYYNENKFRAMMGAIDILGQLVHKRTFSITEEKQNA